MSDTTDSTIAADSALRGGAMLGGAGLVVSYLLAWVDVVGLTRPRGSGPERVAVGSEAVLRQQGFRDNAGATIAGSDIAIVPAAVAVLGLIVILAAAVRWRLATQAITGFLGLLAGGLAVFFMTFLDGNDAEFIQVGDHEGPASSFEPAIGMWLVILCAVVILACSVAGAILQSRRAESPSGRRYPAQK